MISKTRLRCAIDGFIIGSLKSRNRVKRSRMQRGKSLSRVFGYPTAVGRDKSSLTSRFDRIWIEGREFEEKKGFALIARL